MQNLQQGQRLRPSRPVCDGRGHESGAPGGGNNRRLAEHDEPQVGRDKVVERQVCGLQDAGPSLGLCFGVGSHGRLTVLAASFLPFAFRAIGYLG